MNHRRVTGLGLALGIAAGFLAGVLVVAVLGGARAAGPAKTTTVVRVETVASGTAVPDLIGAHLAEAKHELADVGLQSDVRGGGWFGIGNEDNWQVVDQQPAAGARVRPGTTVELAVERA